MHASGPTPPAIPVLAATGLSIANTAGGKATPVGNLTVWPGELHLVFSPTMQDSAAIVDALLGLTSSGEVRFQGSAWAQLTPQDARLLRGRIGSVMGRGNWLESRSVLENLLLPLQHHTMLQDDAIRAMACELALAFGLPGIPTLLPHQCRSSDLERAACIRAFLGNPQLVMLEHPIESTDTKPLPALVDAIQQVRRRDGSVVWFTGNRAVVDELRIVADRRYRVVGHRLLKLDDAA